MLKSYFQILLDITDTIAPTNRVSITLSNTEVHGIRMHIGTSQGVEVQLTAGETEKVHQALDFVKNFTSEE